MLKLKQHIISCRQCPRLIPYIEEVARKKRRAYRDDNYWGKPVPGFGDPAARLMIVGLAPAAHGANRTGRMFTGDSSGDWLYRALYETGFANQPTSVHRKDGLVLTGAYVTSVCRCAPPHNKPNRDEISNCRPFLLHEFDLLNKIRAVVVLGHLAFNTVLGLMREKGYGWPVVGNNGDDHQYKSPEQSPHSDRQKKPRFTHGGLYHWPRPADSRLLPALMASYHPSRQNTNTGRLTEDMFVSVFRHARAIIDDDGDVEKAL